MTENNYPNRPTLDPLRRSVDEGGILHDPQTAAAGPCRETAQLTEARPFSNVVPLDPISACYYLSSPYKNAEAIVLGKYVNITGHSGRGKPWIIPLAWKASRNGEIGDIVASFPVGTTHEAALATLGYQLVR